MTELNIEQARFNMIEQQIRPWDVLDQRVLDVIAATPREAFVPERHRALAFTDLSIPLGHGEVMMPPRLEGRVLQSLYIEPTDRVLEIGTGSGYLSACLAKLGKSVLSVDIHEDFQQQAGETLAAQGINNVSFKLQDAAAGWAPEAGFNVIAITGSLPVLHEGFHRSLAVGGRMFVIVGEPPIMEALLITRVGDNDWSREVVLETSLPPLVNAPRAQSFTL